MRDRRASPAALCCAALLLQASPTLAADRVTELAAQAVDVNPSLAAMRASEDALRQLAAVAGAWPDPTLSLEYTSVPVSTFGLSDHPMSGLQVTASQTLRPAGWSRLQRMVSSHHADHIGFQEEEAALQLRTAVHQTWWMLTQSRMMERVTQTHLTRTDELLSAARSRYETGALGQHAVLRLEVLRAQLLDELEDHQQSDRTLTAALGEALGGERTRTYTTPEVLTPLSPPSERSWIAAAQEHRPLLKALASERDAEASAATLAQLDGRPDVSLWSSYRVRTIDTETDPGADLVSLGVGLPLPIGSARQAEGAAAAAQARARAIEHDHQAALHRIDAQMTTIHAAWTRADSKARTYRETLIPGAQAVLETTRSDFSVGRADFASLFEAEVALLALERAWITAAAQTHLQHAAAMGVLGTSPLGVSP